MSTDSNQSHQQQEEDLVKETEEVAAAMDPFNAGDDEGKECCDVENMWMEGGEGDDIMLDIDGEDLIFSDDAFPSLPDFPCLSSPSVSPSPSSASNYVIPACPSSSSSTTTTTTSSSSSSSASSSSWSFLKDPGVSCVANMQQPAVVPQVMKIPPEQDHQQAIMDSEERDILGNIDLLDPSGPWNPSALFPDDRMMIEEETAPQNDQETTQHHLVQEAWFRSCGGGEGGREESPSETLGEVFLEWLKSNKDSISPEDLRSIKLKRSTIECAARRLGGGQQGMTQLLKLILAWVQNNHLQKKRQQRNKGGGEQELHDYDAGSAFAYQQQTFPSLQQHLPVLTDVPVNPNPSTSLDYNYDTESNFIACSSWGPPSTFPVDSTTGAALPSLMMAYPTDPSASTPYCYHSGASSGLAAASHSFSPSSDFQAFDSGSAWPPHFNGPTHYGSYTGTSAAHPPARYPGGFPNQYPGQQLYHQCHQLARLASATKEARKKRMARQRRFSSLHYHRNQKQHQQDQPQAQSQQQQHSHPTAQLELSSRPPSEGRCGSSNHSSSRSYAFWSCLSSSSQQVNTVADAPNASTMQQLPLPPSLQQQQNNQQNASSSERRQGCKVEKNLRFLLQKVLKQSDVGTLGRIVLPKKEAEIHLPELDARDGISIAMEDIGTSRVWNMRYRFWPNNKSRMYLLENTGDFVRSNGLQEGDFIVIYSDVKCSKYMIRGVKVRQPLESKGSSSKNSGQKKNGSEKSAAFRTKSISSSNHENDDH